MLIALSQKHVFFLTTTFSNDIYSLTYSKSTENTYNVDVTVDPKYIQYTCTYVVKYFVRNSYSQVHSILWIGHSFVEQKSVWLVSYQAPIFHSAKAHRCNRSHVCEEINIIYSPPNWVRWKLCQTRVIKNRSRFWALARKSRLLTSRIYVLELLFSMISYPVLASCKGSRSNFRKSRQRKAQWLRNS